MSGAQASKHQNTKTVEEILQRNFLSLSKIVSSDPLVFAMALYSNKIINRTTMNKIAESSAETRMKKAHDLLNDVTNEMKSKPKAINPVEILITLCSTMEDELGTESANDVASTIREELQTKLNSKSVRSPNKTTKAIRTDFPSHQPSNVQSRTSTHLASAECADNSTHIPEASNPREPPDWIMQSKPRVSSYLPQIGDTVMYFWQGHQNYINVVQRKGIKIINLRLPKHNMSPQECCQVVDFQYSMGTPIVCSLVLLTLRKTRFTIKFHDMDGVPDFLVLKSVYEVAMKISWSPGDRFKSFIDDDYLYGTVLSKQPFNEEVFESNWQLYHIKLDGHEPEHLSPWEMEPTEGKISKIQFAVSKSSIDEEEKDRILQGLSKSIELDEAFQFQELVKAEDEPTYYDVVPFPVALSIIRRRLSNGFYRCKEALLWEVHYIQKNAILFNDKDSLIIEHAKILVQTLWKFINSDSDVTDLRSCYEKMPLEKYEQEITRSIKLMPTVRIDPTKMNDDCSSESSSESTLNLCETNQKGKRKRRKSFNVALPKINSTDIGEENQDDPDYDPGDSAPMDSQPSDGGENSRGEDSTNYQSTTDLTNSSSSLRESSIKDKDKRNSQKHPLSRSATDFPHNYEDEECIQPRRSKRRRPLATWLNDSDSD